MVITWALHTLTHGHHKCRLRTLNPFIRPPRFAARQEYRKKLLSIWLDSISADMDMISDWVFLYHMYGTHGMDLIGGMYARATLALCFFTVLGSISYLLVLYQTVFKVQPISWLSLYTIVCEDVPQILLTLVLSGVFDSYNTKPSPLAAFNIATSVYSALIKLSGELFVNYCYCCSFDLSSDEEAGGEISDHAEMVGMVV
mmetsp:Transcript_2150/g.5057  ORF Transcript_2150/g.5057 Transcript_2150/m.5057 type:complete len:200 (-) Transcript_2150:129-728(-)